MHICYTVVIQLGKKSADDVLIFFTYFVLQIGFEISCKLSLNKICMKYQSIFSVKDEKRIKKY